jgi:hypothetical protein
MMMMMKWFIFGAVSAMIAAVLFKKAPKVDYTIHSSDMSAKEVAAALTRDLRRLGKAMDRKTAVLAQMQFRAQAPMAPPQNVREP